MLPRLLATLVLLSLIAGCSHSSTAARIRRLSAQETKLRASVETLSARQDALRAEIVRAEAAAAAARCEASRESYRAVVATLFAEYSTRLAEYKGCKAKAAKGGGAVMAVGCGLAAFLTGGVALALCGGALATGALISEGSCSSEPTAMTAEDIRAQAMERTGMPREPTCTGSDSIATAASPRYLRSPYGGSGVAQADPQGSLDRNALRKPSRKDVRRYRAAQRKQAKRLKAERKAEKKRAKAARKALKKANRKHQRHR